MASVIRTTQVVGFTSGLIFSSVYFTSSYLIMPPLFDQPPANSATIFREIFYRGATVIVPLALISTATNAYAAYASSVPEVRNLYALAAVAVLAPLPWTALVMTNGIQRLNTIAENKLEQEKASKSEVEGLLRAWTWQNYVRGTLALVGSIASLYAALSPAAIPDVLEAL